MNIEVDIQITTKRTKDGLWSGTVRITSPDGRKAKIHETGFPSDPFARATCLALANELTETLSWGKEKSNGEA